MLTHYFSKFLADKFCALDPFLSNHHEGHQLFFKSKSADDTKQKFFAYLIQKRQTDWPCAELN